MMKALSLSQPWCWSLFDPIADKDCENRSWPPPINLIGQMIAIHAAQSWDDKPLYRPRGYKENGQVVIGEPRTPIGYLLSLGIDHMPGRHDLYAQGQIIGVAVIDRVVTDDKTLASKTKRWFFGPYGWLIPDRRKLATPLPCKGKQGLWTVPPPLEEQIHQQLGTVN